MFVNIHRGLEVNPIWLWRNPAETHITVSLVKRASSFMKRQIMPTINKWHQGIYQQPLSNLSRQPIAAAVCRLKEQKARPKSDIPISPINHMT